MYTWKKEIITKLPVPLYDLLFYHTWYLNNIRALGITEEAHFMTEEPQYQNKQTNEALDLE